MTIKGLSDVRRMPRHLGIKVEKKNERGESVTYPKAVDYFVVPPEVQMLFGEKPKQLDIMFPVEDTDKFASLFYRCYSSFRGLVCKGDGETCTRMVDTATGDFAHRDTKQIEMRDALPCQGQDCPMYQQKKCKEVLMLQFFLPQVPGLGVWQLDTSSYHSIVAINSAVDLIHQICGRISMIPLVLAIEPKEVSVEGRKKAVHILQVRNQATLADIQKVASLPANRVLLPPPDEEKPELLFPEPEEDPAWTELSKETVADRKPAQPVPKIKADVKAAEAPAPFESQPQRDPFTVKNWGELCTACKIDFKMSRNDILKELAVTDFLQLTALPWNCYQQIAARR
jgi:hypothetical protein